MTWAPRRSSSLNKPRMPENGNVRVQIFVLVAVFSVRRQFGRTLEMYRESVTPVGRMERLIREIELEAKPVAVIRNRSVEIIDEKLRGYPSNVVSRVSRSAVWHKTSSERHKRSERFLTIRTGRTTRTTRTTRHRRQP
jgi:hypothetical protein